MQKILVIGSSGLVGSRFVELYQNKYKLLTPSSEDFDITSKASVKDYVSDYKPDFIINFAAYTNVSEAENQRNNKKGECWSINVDGVRNLLKAINSEKTQFIQISTDYVFAGNEDDPGPYAENHNPETDSSKVTWYGFTKAEAERAIISNLGNYATILRIIYPVRARFEPKLDYLRKHLSLFDQGKLYPLFKDQQISITFIDEACEALFNIISKNQRGVFHASSRDTTNPYTIISYLLKKTRGLNKELSSSSLKSVSNRIRYHHFGGLRIEKTEEILGMRFSTWREIVDKLVKQGIS